VIPYMADDALSSEMRLVRTSDLIFSLTLVR